MMSCDFETTTHGKWILAGEHAVIRGHPALIFPLTEKQLTVRYSQSPKPLRVHCKHETELKLQQLLLTAVNQGLRDLHLPQNNLTGLLEVQGNIPIGAGMGASAAVCVAVARWFDTLGLLKGSVFDFAKTLENCFHGKSSGLDIAGVVSETGICFNQGTLIPLNPAWQPSWTLSYSGSPGLTSLCVQQVQKIWKNSPESAQKIDTRMQKAVFKAKSALEVEEISSFLTLKEAIQESLDCFHAWNLINQGLTDHMNKLLDSGAVAVKPTGSGGGGFVIALWAEKPVSLPFEVIHLGSQRSTN
jgi:mevalonate kinase